MIPQRITLENFLSFGAAQTIAFDDDEPLWVLGGPNGVGKSAVFDAITFALFGIHRNGLRIRVPELIRHGSSGFKIVFEFLFDGVEYRITRAHTGRVVPPKLDERIDGEWKPIAGVTKVAELEKWVVAKLGMGYDAFTTSVLLRQGEAEKLFLASRSDRNNVLKNIIGFEQYEALSERVKARTSELRAEAGAANVRFAGMNPVDDTERATAEHAVTVATQARDAAIQGRDDAIRRQVSSAKWQELTGKWNKVNEWLTHAEAAQANAQVVLTQFERWRELQQMLPLVAEMTEARARRETATAKREKLKGEQADHTAQLAEVARQHETSAAHVRALQAEREAAKAVLDDALRQLPQLKNCRDIRKQIDALEQERVKYPADIQALAQTSERDETAARTAFDDAQAKLTKARTLHDAVLKNLSDMRNVKTGVKCTRCRQTVTAEHAAAEVAALEKEAKSLEKELKALDGNAVTAKAQWIEAQKRREQLHRDVAALAALQRDIASQTANLAKLDATQSTAEMTSRIDTLEHECQSAEIAHRERERVYITATADEAKHARRKAEIDAALRKLEPELATQSAHIAHADARMQAVRGRLPENYASAESVRIDDWTRELQHLNNDRVEERALALQRDLPQMEFKRAEAAELHREREAVPPAERLSPAEAQAIVAQAEAARTAAEANLATAQDALRGVRDRAARFQEADTERGLKEKALGLHKKLDALLGNDGLMRALIRDAEREVVTLADETLRQLTHQEMSLELEEEADKTFAMQVRRASDDEVTAVEFLSGSQRFRVAVSIALAIGRFATRSRRSIEAVIIDEGFGSLDDDGLRSMAENLHELRRTQALKRIILVSHQKNFTDQFPVGYRLKPGPGGTTVERFTHHVKGGAEH